MRFLIGSVVVLASCLAIFAATPDARAFEQQINDALECIRGLLGSGIPEKGVPSFNPLELSSGAANLSALGVDGLSGHISVENLYIAGLLDFQQSNIKGTIGLIPPRYTVQLTLTFPLTSVSTKYDVDVTYTPKDIHIYGAGDLSVEAVNFAVDLDVTVSILGGISIRKFELWVSLEGLNSFNLTGLFNDEEYSAQTVEDVLADPSGLVAEYSQKINDAVSDIVTNAVANGALEDDGFLSSIIYQCISLK